MENHATPSSVRSLHRGLQIMACFQDGESPLSLSQIAKRTGISGSTASRLLNTLVACNFLQKNADKKYTLGDLVFKLADLNKPFVDLRQIAFPFLENMRNIFDETVSLYVARNDVRVCLESVQSRQPLRRTVETGEVLPLTQGAVGYMLLAWQSYTKRQKIIADHSDITEMDLSKIRQEGYVINNEVHEPGVFAIAAPIMNYHGQCVAAIALSGPSSRLGRAEISELITSIVATANNISAVLPAGI